MPAVAAEAMEESGAAAVVVGKPEVVVISVGLDRAGVGVGVGDEFVVGEDPVPDPVPDAEGDSVDNDSETGTTPCTALAATASADAAIAAAADVDDDAVTPCRAVPTPGDDSGDDNGTSAPFAGTTAVPLCISTVLRREDMIAPAAAAAAPCMFVTCSDGAAAAVVK